MAIGFLQAGWIVHVATAPSTPRRDKAEWKGVVLHEFSISGIGNLGSSHHGQISELLRFIRNLDADCLICHSWDWATNVPPQIFHSLRSQKILVSHGFGAHLVQWHRRFPFGLGLWLRWQPYVWQMPALLRKFDALVFLSARRDRRAFFDHTLGRLFAGKRCHVIPNGVALDESNGSAPGFRAEHGITPGSFVLVCIANYSKRKDQAYAARAFRRAQLSDATLIFIGSERNEWSDRFGAEDRAFAAVHPQGEIRWLEKLDRKTTLSALAAADVAVLSANHEAQPIFLLEAMRASVPWIARDAGCIAEMPGGICVRSEDQMSSAMRQLSENPIERSRLAAEGRRACEEKFNRQHYTSSYFQLVNQLCASSDSSHPLEHHVITS